jgi:hypothetical protein
MWTSSKDASIFETIQGLYIFIEIYWFARRSLELQSLISFIHWKANRGHDLKY